LERYASHEENVAFGLALAQRIILVAHALPSMDRRSHLVVGESQPCHQRFHGNPSGIDAG
jgi:hypothetical protein